MNELYVSAPVKRDEAAKTSDDVFFTEHVDGPYCFFPFASVFRCIVALDANVPGYETHFPNAHRSVAAEHGDILAFDFHRESHYITMKPGRVRPEAAARGGSHAEMAHAPVGAEARGVGVNGTTVAYNALEKYVGFSNLASYGTLAAVAYAVESYALFLYARSSSRAGKE
ncbi:phospholipid methyltransferase [Aureococcus anophagefferens]|nr:phospholipid methyltransferase [Aureococcus anophagefferens]